MKGYIVVYLNGGNIAPLFSPTPVYSTRLDADRAAEKMLENLAFYREHRVIEVVDAHEL